MDKTASHPVAAGKRCETELHLLAFIEDAKRIKIENMQNVSRVHTTNKMARVRYTKTLKKYHRLRTRYVTRTREPSPDAHVPRRFRNAGLDGLYDSIYVFY